jgi:hypothetical protein
MTTTLKTCLKCGVEKPVEDFYIKHRPTNRLRSRCKICHTDDAKAYRASHVDDFKEKERRRAMLPHRVAARDKWEAKYPERIKAIHTVRNAIQKGYLVRLPCIVCGNKKSHGHHENYDHPLDVVWLCAKHHKARHEQLKKDIK